MEQNVDFFARKGHLPIFSVTKVHLDKKRRKWKRGRERENLMMRSYIYQVFFLLQLYIYIYIKDTV